MKYKTKLSQELSRAIKDNTTPEQREIVAVTYGMSVHTMNSIINRQRNINHRNHMAINEVVSLAILNTNENGKTLTNYREDLYNKYMTEDYIG
jgi:hypothetical protein